MHMLSSESSVYIGSNIYCERNARHATPYKTIKQCPMLTSLIVFVQYFQSCFSYTPNGQIVKVFNIKKKSKTILSFWPFWEIFWNSEYVTALIKNKSSIWLQMMLEFVTQTIILWKNYCQMRQHCGCVLRWAIHQGRLYRGLLDVIEIF